MTPEETVAKLEAEIRAWVDKGAVIGEVRGDQLAQVRDAYRDTLTAHGVDVDRLVFTATWTDVERTSITVSYQSLS